MNRRKGEISSAQIDKVYPHQIALPQSFTVPNFLVLVKFCDGSMTACLRTKSVFYDDETYVIYCFGARDEAEAFHAEFDGEWFNPADRGTGDAWARWRSEDAG